jgi:hypothetical protein
MKIEIEINEQDFLTGYNDAAIHEEEKITLDRAKTLISCLSDLYIMLTALTYGGRTVNERMESEHFGESFYVAMTETSFEGMVERHIKAFNL